MTVSNTSPQAPHQSHPFVDLVLSILIPSLILMKLSGEAALGARGALLLALTFPFLWGAFELARYRRFNWIALFGLVSVLLTGGIGLLQLDASWLAIKEAAIPGVLGIAVFISARTGKPFIKMFVMNPRVCDVKKIAGRLSERNEQARFEHRLVHATYLLSGTFFFSSAMNYILAKTIVTSAAGTQAFNEELARLTLLSYPVIAVPSMIMTFGIVLFLWRTIRTLTGLSFEEILAIKKSPE